MKLKKTLCLITVMMLVLSLTACGGESAEQAVINGLTAIQNMDNDEMELYFGTEDPLNKEEDEDMGKETLMPIVEKMTYKIISSDEESGNASVKAEITNIDMEIVMGKYLKELFAKAFSSDKELTDEETNKIFTDLINNEDNEVTQTVDIKLDKDQGGWLITMDEPLLDAILGGLISATNDLASGFNEGENTESETPERKLSEISNFIITDIWNEGFVDISWYIQTGKSSTLESIDIDFTIWQLDDAMDKKEEYDEYINGLQDEKYSKVKQTWSKLSPEIDRLYEQIKDNKPKANDTSYNFDTGLFKQYRDAFQDEVYTLNE